MSLDDRPTERSYVRVQARYRGRLGVEVGIFVAVDHLRRAGILSPDEEAQYFDIDDWFRAQLPNPPFYDDGNSVGAITWFKSPLPREMSERVETMCAILAAHDVAYDVVGSDAPGEQIYEDDFQVGDVARVRDDPSPMPEGLEFSPTSAGSKRQFAQETTRASATLG
ncbi:hypothetical protein [Microbacterium alcoholitolerans]|uniref:hypothetical protein n=1 Tax=unclassified Microbacterium TaxID=2609290 RepID=UPI003D1773F5